MVHDSGAPAKSTDGEPAADYFAERSQVRANAKEFLGAATSHAETGHHFVENQERTVAVAFVAKCLKKIFARKIEAGVGGNWFENDCCDRFRIFMKGCAHGFDIVKGNGNR